MNTIQNNGISVSVNINGHPVKTYLHENKYFIESRDGTEYAVEIKNNNWFRVEAVVAVDGLSVMNGKTASKSESGYIIRGYDKLVVKGFRKSTEEVGAFKFTAKEKSYAAGKGDSSNVGIIAIAVYREKQAVQTWYNGLIGSSTTTTLPDYTWTSNTVGGTMNNLNAPITYKTCTNDLKARVSNSMHATAFNSSTDMGGVLRSVQSSVDFEHGTTWGKKIEDKVVTVEFQRDGLVMNTEVYYNSKANLEEMGIKLIQEKQVAFPKGFPSDYAEPPVGWNG